MVRNLCGEASCRPLGLEGFNSIKEKLEGIGMPLLGESRDREREWKN